MPGPAGHMFGLTNKTFLGAATSTSGIYTTGNSALPNYTLAHWVITWKFDSANKQIDILYEVEQNSEFKKEIYHDPLP